MPLDLSVDIHVTEDLVWGSENLLISTSEAAFIHIRILFIIS